MTTFELLSLIFQIIGTLATIFACIGIYYAKRSLDIAKNDYKRKLHLETKTYVRNQLKDLSYFFGHFNQVENDQLTNELIENDIQIRSNISNFLNLIEEIHNDLEDGLYDNNIILDNIKIYMLIVRAKCLSYIEYKRYQNRNPHLWRGVIALFETIDKRS